MVKRIINYTIIGIGGIFTILMLLAFARDTSSIINWSSSGFVQCAVRYPVDSTLTFVSVTKDDFISENVPSETDTLIFIDGLKADLDLWIEKLELPHEPGKEVPITFLKDGSPITAVMKTRPVQKPLFIAVIALQALKLPIFFTFLTVGFWAFFKRSDSTGVRALTMYSISMASIMIFPYMPMFSQVSSIHIPFEDSLKLFNNIIILFFSSFWLLLNFVFPRKSPLYSSKPAVIYIICFLPQLAAVGIYFIVGDGNYWLGYLIAGIFFSQIIAGLLILRKHYFKAYNNIERRQTKLVFFGSGATLFIYLVLVLDKLNIYINIIGNLSLTQGMTLNNILFFLLLSSPISFAYAFGKYRLLEVEARLRRGTRYLIVTGALFLVFFGLIYLIGVLFLESVGITGRAPTLLVALGLALGFAPAQKSVRLRLEQRFYPEKENLRRMIHDFLSTASSLPDCVSLCGGIENRLIEGLRVDKVLHILKDNNSGNFHLKNGLPVPFDSAGNFYISAQQSNHPIMVDEALASEKIDFTEDERNWLLENKIALLLPIKLYQQTSGFLAVGYKNDHDDFNPEEIQILMTLSEQIALALENLRLLEDNLEKKRLEEELSIARKVQLGFLPLKIPETAGLSISAKSKFSLEVAGDYYDVIPLDDGFTLLAVGDVSGKGAGAAMIMANLQASLKALSTVGLEMSEIAARINNIIYGNTEADQYISLFMAIFSAKDMTLTYVNAGHNPPILKSGTDIQLLEEGGMILGAFKDAEYQQSTISLSKGDFLLIYTDGITEAMDEKENEFGEERIIEILHQKSESSVETITSQIIDSVRLYTESESCSDDMTLMAVKVE